MSLVWKEIRFHAFQNSASSVLHLGCDANQLEHHLQALPISPIRHPSVNEFPWALESRGRYSWSVTDGFVLYP